MKAALWAVWTNRLGFERPVIVYNDEPEFLIVISSLTFLSSSFCCAHRLRKRRVDPFGHAKRCL
jgi:hypothetical protein